ncbi:MAG: GGDEF domain-containing phosphodiesterase [Saccharofermentans sp.]|nr:GGDEF domain-containing phosphodiesterase [Saccharofermentans sp.]
MSRGNGRSILSGKAIYFITMIFLTLGFVALLALHCVLRNDNYSIIFLFLTMLVSFAINLLYDKFGFYASFALNFIQSMIYIYEIATQGKSTSRVLLVGTFLIMIINLALQFYRVHILSQATNEREKNKKLRSDEISRSLEQDMNERPSLITNYTNATKNGSSVYDYSVMPHLDPLTTLPGRDMVRDKIDRMIMGSTGSVKNDNTSYTTDSKFMVIYLSVDNASKLADCTGNCNMDLFIQNISHRLREACDPSDMLARANDAQFIILSKRILSEDKLESYIDKLTNRILRALRAGLDSLPAVISYGTASYPAQGRDGGALINHAEMNRTICYDNTDKVSYPSSTKDTKPKASASSGSFSFEGMSRDEIISVFEEAISSGNLYMSYQPYYTNERKLKGIEAFLRLRIGNELVPPPIFLAAAEHAGYMNRISSFSLEEALGVIARANEKVQDLSLNLNISASQFSLPDFISQFNNAVSNSDASIASLVLDVPESTLVSELDTIRNTIEKLSGMGVRMALNNFGSGYSSFNTIPLLPISVVKLDPSFTSNIPSRADARILTSSVISVLHDIDISVCATGIENADQYSYLSGAGCDYFQGTYMSEEVRGDRFIASLS